MRLTLAFMLFKNYILINNIFIFDNLNLNKARLSKKYLEISLLIE